MFTRTEAEITFSLILGAGLLQKALVALASSARTSIRAELIIYAYGEHDDCATVEERDCGV